MAEIRESQAEQGGDGAPASSAYRAAVLFILVVVYAFNFIDRQIVGILAGAIKGDLHLTDTQLGWMGGPAFALFYTLLGIPIAWLADRWSRTWIMTIALAVWSAFTAACGLVTSFPMLFGARVGVGVGEAGGVAPAYSLVSDYFPPRERARALAVYSFGIPIGSALGVLFGGLIAHWIDWRAAFLAVGGAGILLAPVFRMIVREPRHGGLDGPVRPVVADAPREPTPGFFAVMATLLPKPSFWLLSLGAGFSSLVGYGVIFWFPTFLQRSFHLGLVERSWYYAGMLFFGGVAGVWIGGWLADRLGRIGKAAYALIPAVAFLLAAPCFIYAMFSATPAMAFWILLVPQALSLMWLAPVINAIQHLAPPAMRSTASAIFLFINNLIGLGCGSLFFGAAADWLKPTYGDQALKYALLYGLGFYALSAALLLLAAPRLKKDWVNNG